jgi:hypothetical protein
MHVWFHLNFILICMVELIFKYALNMHASFNFNCLLNMYDGLILVKC